MPTGSARVLLLRLATATVVTAASFGGAVALAGSANAVSSDASAYLSGESVEINGGLHFV